jgi:hypothetical protein
MSFRLLFICHPTLECGDLSPLCPLIRLVTYDWRNKQDARSASDGRERVGSSSICSGRELSADLNLRKQAR